MFGEDNIGPSDELSYDKGRSKLKSEKNRSSTNHGRGSDIKILLPVEPIGS